MATAARRATPDAGQALADENAELRERVIAWRQEIEAIERAPLPADEAKQAFRAVITREGDGVIRMAAQDALRGDARFAGPDHFSGRVIQPGNGGGSQTDALGIRAAMAVLGPQFIEMVSDAIDLLAEDNPPGLPSSERPGKIKALRESIQQAQARIEETHRLHETLEPPAAVPLYRHPDDPVEVVLAGEEGPSVLRRLETADAAMIAAYDHAKAKYDAAHVELQRWRGIHKEHTVLAGGRVDGVEVTRSKWSLLTLLDEHEPVNSDVWRSLQGSDGEHAQSLLDLVAAHRALRDTFAYWGKALEEVQSSPAAGLRGLASRCRRHLSERLMTASEQARWNA